MASVFAVGNHVILRLWTSDAEQAAVNTLRFTVAAIGGSPATDQDLADQADPFFGSLYKALINNNANWNGVQVSQIPPGPLPPFSTVFQNGAFGPGTAGAIALPRQTAGLITLHTALAGRAFRGRIYLPFPAAADDAGNGTPSGGYIGRLITLGPDFSGGIFVSVGGRTATLVRVLVHRKNVHGLIPDPTPTNGFSASNLWATQRRRGSYGRANRSPI